MLAGVALTIGVLGYYVMVRTRAADETARAAAAREAAMIEADNARKLREAERQFRSPSGDNAALPDAGASDAGSPDSARGKRRRRAPTAPVEPKGEPAERTPRAGPSAL
jgi:hypothetical protein